MGLLTLCGCGGRGIEDEAKKPPVKDEVSAVKFVETLGGKVMRDGTKPGNPVVQVKLTYTQVTDAGLKELAPLKNLKTLYLGYSQITDAGLLELAALQNLTALEVSGRGVTDEGIQKLQKLLPKCRIAEWL